MRPRCRIGSGSSNEGWKSDRVMMEQVAFSTADLWDEHHDLVEVLELDWRSFGGRSRFQGQVVTLRTDDDHRAVREVLEEPGIGRVLLVDAGGQRRIAMLGDRLAALAARNGWSGVVVNGPVRDSDALRGVGLGVVALGTTARRSFDARATHRRDVSVEVGDATVKPGDWIYVDSDAVIIAPASLLQPDPGPTDD